MGTITATRARSGTATCAPDGDGGPYSVCVGGHDDDPTCVLTATGPDVATARANAALAATAPPSRCGCCGCGMLRAASGALAATRDDVQRLRAGSATLPSRRTGLMLVMWRRRRSIIAHESRWRPQAILSVGRRYHVTAWVTRHTLAMDVDASVDRRRLYAVRVAGRRWAVSDPDRTPPPQ